MTGDDNSGIHVLVQNANAYKTTPGFSVFVDLRFAWFKAGNVSIDSSGGLHLTPAGLPEIHLYSTAPGTNMTSSGIHFSLDHGPVGFSTSANPTVEGLQEILQQACEQEKALLSTTFKDRAGEAQAIKAAAMYMRCQCKHYAVLTLCSSRWTLVSTPAENGGAPLLPVSRSWSFAPNPINNDFTYAIFDWYEILLGRDLINPALCCSGIICLHRCLLRMMVVFQQTRLKRDGTL